MYTVFPLFEVELGAMCAALRSTVSEMHGKFAKLPYLGNKYGGNGKWTWNFEIARALGRNQAYFLFTGNIFFQNDIAFWGL